MKKLLCTLITAALATISLASASFAAVALDDKMKSGTDVMMMMDKDKDGMVSRDEFMKSKEAVFNKMDANKDGMMDKDEQATMLKGSTSTSTTNPK